jgi:hypothetical protein
MVQPGDALVAATLNDQNDDFASPFVVNSGNVRTEGIDSTTFARVTTGESGLVLIDARSQSTVGTIGTYTSTATPAAVELNHGSGTRVTYGAGGQAIITGDVIRAYWQLVVEDYVAAQGGAEGLLWVVYLQWDITSAALGNFVAVPGQGDFNTAYPDTVDTTGSPTSTTRATMVIPNGMAYRPVGDATPTLTMYHEHLSPMRMYTYQHTGATVTVYGMRLMIRGLCYGSYDATYPFNRIVQLDTSGVDDAEIDIGAAQLGVLIMRGS